MVSYPAARARARARSKSRPTFCGACASEASVIGADVIALEAELHRQALPLGLEDRIAVRGQVVDAALDVVRQCPQLARLAEVVDVLGEADLVHTARGRSLDEPLDGLAG